MLVLLKILLKGAKLDKNEQSLSKHAKSLFLKF